MLALLCACALAGGMLAECCLAALLGVTCAMLLPAPLLLLLGWFWTRWRENAATARCCLLHSGCCQADAPNCSPCPPTSSPTSSPAPAPLCPQVSGEAIRAMAPGQRAEVDALRNAFGTDYEAKLRKEAGGWGWVLVTMPSCASRRMSGWALQLAGGAGCTAACRQTCGGAKQCQPTHQLAQTPALTPPHFLPSPPPGLEPDKLTKWRHQVPCQLPPTPAPHPCRTLPSSRPRARQAGQAAPPDWQPVPLGKAAGAGAAGRAGGGGQDQGRVGAQVRLVEAAAEAV